MDEPYALPPRPRKTRRGPIRRSFLLVAVLPTLLVALYFGLVARPRYITQFRFSIYQPNNNGPQQGNGSIAAAASTGGDLPSAAPTVADYVVADYLTSPQVILDLEKRMDLRQMLDDPKGDLLGRYWWGDGTPERMLWYWNTLTTNVSFDVTTGLTTVSVTTYSPRNALIIADALQTLSESVVNNMSAGARQDKVRFAESAVRRIDTRLKDVLLREQALRNAQKSPDPSAAAQAMLTYTDTLRQSIDTLTAEDSVLARSIAPNAPTRRVLHRQIEAAQAQLREATKDIGGDTSPDHTQDAKLPRQMNAYEYLELERNFLTTFDSSLLQLLETARLDAATQHNYLETYVSPYAPRHARLPRPIRWTALTFIGLSTLWLIGLLIVLSVKDHMLPSEPDAP